MRAGWIVVAGALTGCFAEAGQEEEVSTSTGGSGTTVQPSTPSAQTGSASASTTQTGADSSGGSTVATESTSTSDTTGAPSEPWRPRQLWLATIDSGEAAVGDRVDDLAVAEDGTIWAAGAFSQQAGASQLWVGHLDEGVVIDSFVYTGSTELTNSRSIVATQDGYLIGGHGNSATGGTDRLLLSLDLRARSFSPFVDFGATVGYDIIHDVFVAGGQTWFAGAVSDTGSQQLWFGRFLPGGDWEVREGIPGLEASATAIFREPRGGNPDIVVTGWIENRMGDQDGWIARYSSLGGERWTTTLSGDAGTDQILRGVTQDSSGDYIAVGTTEVEGESANVLVQRFGAASGGVGWSATYDGDGGDDIARAAAIGPGGVLFACGSTTVPGEQANWWVGKYDEDGNELGVLVVDGGLGDDDLVLDCVVNSDTIVLAGTMYTPGGVDRDGFVAAYSID